VKARVKTSHNPAFKVGDTFDVIQEKESSHKNNKTLKLFRIHPEGMSECSCNETDCAHLHGGSWELIDAG